MKKPFMFQKLDKEDIFVIVLLAIFLIVAFHGIRKTQQKLKAVEQYVLRFKAEYKKHSHIHERFEGNRVIWRENGKVQVTE